MRDEGAINAVTTDQRTKQTLEKLREARSLILPLSLLKKPPLLIP